MNRELFVHNVKALCALRNIAPTVACRESGVGNSFINNIEARGSIPSVAKVQMLAQYLGVTTSELLGETCVRQVTGEVIDVPYREEVSAPASLSPELQSLSAALEQLNEEGQEKLLDYAADLVASGRYKKDSQAGVGQKA